MIADPVYRVIPGFGLIFGDRACDCKACYATSVRLSASAVDGWNGRRKCLLQKSEEKISPKLRKQMLHFIETVTIMQHENKKRKEG